MDNIKQEQPLCIIFDGFSNKWIESFRREFLAELRHIWMPCGLQAIDLSSPGKISFEVSSLCFASKSKNYNQIRSAFSTISFFLWNHRSLNKTQWWPSLPVVFFEMRRTRLTALVVPSNWCLTSCFGSQDILAIGFWDI